MRNIIILKVDERDASDYEENYGMGFSKSEGNSKLEKVPETWEDLKELCENLEQKVNNLIVKFLPPKTHYDCEAIWFKQYGLWVDSNGFVLFKKDIEEDMVGGARNRTYAQMWNIIKSLTEQK